MQNEYVEIIGMVKDDLSVKALTSINLGERLGESNDLKLTFRYEGCGCARRIC
jgi:hypothetical protein